MYCWQCKHWKHEGGEKNWGRCGTATMFTSDKMGQDAIPERLLFGEFGSVDDEDEYKSSVITHLMFFCKHFELDINRLKPNDADTN